MRQRYDEKDEVECVIEAVADLEFFESGAKSLKNIARLISINFILTMYSNKEIKGFVLSFLSRRSLLNFF